MKNEIIQGDALNVLRTLQEESINCVMTSPPYWALRDYGSETETIWDEVKEGEDGAAGCPHFWGEEIKNKTELQAGNPEFKRPWREEASNISNSQFCTCCGAWKGQLGLEPTFVSQAPHHWFSAESYPSVEDWNKLKDLGFVLFEFDKKMTEVFSKSSEKTTSSEGKRTKRTVWRICPKPFKDAHFAVYPEELCETPIKAGCPKGGIVLDPFFGAGTTGLVALKQKKKFIGVELNPEYIEIINKRLKPYLEQTTL